MRSTTVDWRQQGLQAFNAGRFDVAITAWSHLPQSDVRVRAALAEAHFRRALSRTQLAERPGRMADLQRAVDLAGHDLRYQYHLGLALHRLHDLPGAERQYRAVLQQDAAWPGAGVALALAVLAQNPQADIAALPGSTPAVRAALAPVVALLHGQLPNRAGDAAAPMEQLWEGLGLVLAEDPSAGAVLAANGSLPTPSAVQVRRYYRGVAAAQTGDLAEAQRHWQIAIEEGFRRTWVLANFSAAAVQEISACLEADDGVGAATIAHRVASLMPVSGAAAAVLVQALDAGAHAAAAQADWARAVMLWESARQMVSGSNLGSPRPLLHNLALAYEAQEDWLQAAEAWRAMLRTRPRKKPQADDTGLSEAQWAWVRKRVVECYQKAGAPGEAVTIFRQAIKADPNDLDTRLQLVDALLANEQEQAAQNELQRILQIDPQHVDAQLRLATIHATYGEWYAARHLLQAVLARHPDREDARRQMARLLLAQGSQIHNAGQFAAAARLFEEGWQFAPDNYEFPLNLARIAIDRKQIDKARALLEKTLDLASDRPDAYLEAIDCWIVANQMADARAVYARAESALTLTSDFYLNLGVLVLTRRSPQTSPFAPLQPARAQSAEAEWVAMARESFDRAVALRPDEPRVYGQIAAEIMPFQPAMALEYCEKAVAQLPDEPHLLMLLGLLQGLNERVTEAKKTLLRGARLARQQGDVGLAQQIESLRQQVGSPFLRLSMQMGPLLDELDEDDELF